MDGVKRLNVEGSGFETEARLSLLGRGVRLAGEWATPDHGATDIAPVRIAGKLHPWVATAAAGDESSFESGWLLVRLSRPQTDRLPDGSFSLTTGMPELDALILESGIQRIVHALPQSAKAPRFREAFRRHGLDRIYRFHVPWGTDVPEIVGSHRWPSTWYLDASINYRFNLWKTTVGARLEVFHVFDRQAQISGSKSDGPDFGEPLGVGSYQSPRDYRLSFTMSW